MEEIAKTVKWAIEMAQRAKEDLELYGGMVCKIQISSPEEGEKIFSEYIKFTDELNRLAQVIDDLREKLEERRDELITN